MSAGGTLTDVVQHSKAVADGFAIAASAVVLLGWLTHILGVIAAGLAVVWWCFRIYGEPGFQAWLKRFKRKPRG